MIVQGWLVQSHKYPCTAIFKYLQMSIRLDKILYNVSDQRKNFFQFTKLLNNRYLEIQ